LHKKEVWCRGFFGQFPDVASIKNSVSCAGEYSPNFDLEDMISTSTTDFSFHGKNGPNSPDFKRKKFQVAKNL
jgi:hypothetical protein